MAWLDASTRMIELRPPSVTQAAPSGAVITPWGRDPSPRSIMWLAPDDGSSRPSSPASWAVNQTRPSMAGLTSWGPEPCGTGNASIVNTGSTRTTTVVAAEVVSASTVGSGETGAVTAPLTGVAADVDSGRVSTGSPGGVATAQRVASGIEAGDDESSPEHEPTTARGDDDQRNECSLTPSTRRRRAPHDLRDDAARRSRHLLMSHTRRRGTAAGRAVANRHPHAAVGGHVTAGRRVGRQRRTTVDGVQP